MLPVTPADGRRRLLADRSQTTPRRATRVLQRLSPEQENVVTENERGQGQQ
jgi:hypothetical protein